MKLKGVNDFYKLRDEIKKEKEKNKNIKVLLGFGTCGQAAGAKKIEEILKKEISEKNLKNVELIRVGCVGYCYAEPTIEVVYPDGKSVIVGHMTPENTPDIVEIHILNKNLESQYVIPRNFD